MERTIEGVLDDLVADCILISITKLSTEGKKKLVGSNIAQATLSIKQIKEER